MNKANSPEARLILYSHDYSNDTLLEYKDFGGASQIRLSFTSEDEDFGEEELYYYGNNGESMQELVQELLNEITSYLDFLDHSSFYEHQGILLGGDLEDYGEYSRTSLYAFEGMLKQIMEDEKE